MSDHVTSRRQALRDCAALLSCVVFFLTAALPTMLLVARGYCAVFSLPAATIIPGRHVVGLLATMLVALMVGGYGGVIVWLGFARFVFRLTRAEVLRCAYAGTPAKSDDWLIARFFPHG